MTKTGGTSLETTLASRSLASRAKRLRLLGYDFRLIYLWAPGPEFAVQRVADRVRLGGHHIPEDTIRRRYWAGLKNFFHLYKPLSDNWSVDENTASEGIRMIAGGTASGALRVQQIPLWELIQERARRNGES